MPRGPKKHLKRLNAPSHWMLDKLGGVFVSSRHQLMFATLTVAKHKLSRNAWACTAAHKQAMFDHTFAVSSLWTFVYVCRLPSHHQVPTSKENACL